MNELDQAESTDTGTPEAPPVQDLPNPETPKVDASVPLRDTIRAAMKTVSERPEPDTTGERNRDGTGKFAKEEPSGNRIEAPKPEGVTPAIPAQVKGPDGWPVALREKFATLPTDVQAEITRRETEAHKKITAQDADRDFGKKIRAAAAPFEADILVAGATHEQAFQNYLTTSKVLRTGSPSQKAQALQHLAKVFNVDMSLQSDPRQVASPQPAAADVRQVVQAEIQAQHIRSEVEAFETDPKHEHYGKVKPIMAALLQSGSAANLQDAYDRACYADPEIRSTMATAAPAQSQGSNPAQAAKRAAVSVTGGPGGARPANSTNGTGRSLADEIRANLRTVTGRV